MKWTWVVPLALCLLVGLSLSSADSEAAAPKDKGNDVVKTYKPTNMNEFLGNVAYNRVVDVSKAVIAGAVLSNKVSTNNFLSKGKAKVHSLVARRLRTDKLVANVIASPEKGGIIFIDSAIRVVLKVPKKPKPGPKGKGKASAKGGSKPKGKGKATAKGDGKVGAKAKGDAKPKGDAKAKGGAKPKGNADLNSVQVTSFIAEEIILSGVKQWRLVRHDNFESKVAEGWSLPEAVSSCDGRDHFLGGYCLIGAGEVNKTFSNLPPHSQIRVTARYHFIDNWNGEMAYMKLQGSVNWVDHLKRPAHAQGISMCGHVDYPEYRMSTPIDVSVPHSESSISIAFGSSGSSEQSPCQRSFGVDDVMIYVR